MFLLVLLYTEYAKKNQNSFKNDKTSKIFLKKEDNNHLLKSTKLHILKKKSTKLLFTIIHTFSKLSNQNSKT